MKQLLHDINDLYDNVYILCTHGFYHIHIYTHSQLLQVMEGVIVWEKKNMVIAIFMRECMYRYACVKNRYNIEIT